MRNTRPRRKDTGRPGNGGKFDHTAGGRSSANLDEQHTDTEREAAIRAHIEHRDHLEAELEARDAAFNAPLDRIRLLRVWALEGEMLRLEPGQSTSMPDGAGGTWHVVVDDWDPENTAACGLVESGQYNAAHLDANGERLPDFSIHGFTDLAERRKAASTTAEYLLRCERATEERLAREQWEAEQEASANSVMARLGASMAASLHRAVAEPAPVPENR